MSLSDLAWLALAAYAVHILEEYTLDWRNWARAVIKLPVEWSDFYVTNAIVVTLGLVQANLSSSLPIATLSFAALMIINATFFHIFPTILNRGRFSPGLVTAVLLFYPIGFGIYSRAASTGRLSLQTVIYSIVVGGLLMMFPIVMLKMRDKPYFKQS